ncbi:hypothetical protein FIBSPDRAFT_889065 [Athelia psychrophila]|uniref:Uncharacterized protein n=1 Tax=Athelia psychrophila TaxID=1759441 RepID=A0A166MKV6_9AGAM|nr:hypothetical protein FIBSPDRAFT_889065 [Fibularhizoctonia sp. CBS 109695]
MAGPSLSPISLVTQHAQATHTSDSGKLKSKIISYLPRNINEDIIQHPILVIVSKAMRGFNHSMLAQLQLGGPIEGQYDCCGAWGLGPIYNPEEPEVGLLQGYLPLWIIKHIFTAPSSALRATAGPGCGTHANNTKIHSKTKLTGCDITYRAVQTWFTLSTMEAWGPDHRSFSVSQLFDLVLELFKDDPSSDWVVSTLESHGYQSTSRRQP